MTVALQIAPSAARVEEGERLWAPPEALAANAAVERFRYWVNARLGLDLADYDALWRWSIDDSEAFWAAIWAYFDIQSDTPYQRVRSQIGRASCREKVCQYVWISVVAVSLKKQHHTNI